MGAPENQETLERGPNRNSSSRAIADEPEGDRHPRYPKRHPLWPDRRTFQATAPVALCDPRQGRRRRRDESRRRDQRESHHRNGDLGSNKRWLVTTEGGNHHGKNQMRGLRPDYGDK